MNTLRTFELGEEGSKLFGRPEQKGFLHVARCNFDALGLVDTASGVAVAPDQIVNLHKDEVLFLTANPVPDTSVQPWTIAYRTSDCTAVALSQTQIDIGLVSYEAVVSDTCDLVMV